MKAVHQNLAGGNWSKLSLCEQLGNVGSEVGRTFSGFRGGNQTRADQAASRALELLDLTLADQRWAGRYKEIARAREVFCEALESQDGSGLEKYFNQFAIAARLNR